MRKIFDWIIRFSPQILAVDTAERLRSCCGALIGILITGLVTQILLGPDPVLPVLIAPMGASAVLLFAVPSSPLAQPWSIIGGNVISAAVGVTCAQWINDTTLAASIAITCAIGIMFALRCLHPPGGAVALTAVLGGPTITSAGYHFIWSPVAINSILLVSVALAFNYATRRKHLPIPKKNTGSSAFAHEALPQRQQNLTLADVDNALKQYNQVIDVSREDLALLLEQTEMQAYRRRIDHMTCADIMVRDPVAVEFGTTLEEAWTLLRNHKVKALPVIDRANRVIGIVTQSDFLNHANLEVYPDSESNLRQFIKRTAHTHSPKAEVVGQIMSAPVQTAGSHLHIVELVPLLSTAGLRQIPIINNERHLVGMISQADLIAALYHKQLDDAAQYA